LRFILGDRTRYLTYIVKVNFSHHLTHYQYFTNNTIR
jgi:hypothetical protein